MKFAMGADTLGVLTKSTSGSSDDLQVLVRQLFEAAEPLEGRFQGAGRAAFDRFKSRTDVISAELKASLDGVLGGIGGGAADLRRAVVQAGQHHRRGFWRPVFLRSGNAPGVDADKL